VHGCPSASSASASIAAVCAARVLPLCSTCPIRSRRGSLPRDDPHSTRRAGWLGSPCPCLALTARSWLLLQGDQRLADPGAVATRALARLVQRHHRLSR
jgi:hypothetical protein